jgi:hypothetical protein
VTRTRLALGLESGCRADGVGYTSGTIVGMLAMASGLGRWMDARGLAPGDLDRAAITKFCDARRAAGMRRCYLKQLSRRSYSREQIDCVLSWPQTIRGFLARCRTRPLLVPPA